MMLDLNANANACVDFARRAHRCSWSRSESVNTRPAFGRPERGRSASPASRDAVNRRCTLWTVIAITPSCSASRAYTTPGSEQASTILARTDPLPSPAAHSASRLLRPGWDPTSVADVTRIVFNKLRRRGQVNSSLTTVHEPPPKMVPEAGVRIP